MHYLTLREREAQWAERAELMGLVVKYSAIGGVAVWVLFNW